MSDPFKKYTCESYMSFIHSFIKYTSINYISGTNLFKKTTSFDFRFSLYRVSSL